MRDLELMVPGPVPISKETRAALGAPITAHYGRGWAEFYHDTMQRLGRVFQTKEEVVCIVGSGTAGLEAALSSCVARDEILVVLSNGLFGDRLIEIARSHGIKVVTVSVSPTSAIDPELLEDTLRRTRSPAAVAVVHCESSSGVLNPIRDLAAVAHRKGVPVIVDAISSLGGVDLRMDEWGIDVCVTASQKALQGPPGLALVAVAAKMWDRIRSLPSPGWYLNLRVWKHYAEKWKDNHPYPTTMSTPLVRALRQAVDEILSEGLMARFERHQRTAYELRRRLEALGFEPFLNERIASPTIVAMGGHEKISPDSLVRELLLRYGIRIARGLGPTEGKIFRVGNMGFQASLERVDKLASAIEDLLSTL